MDRHIIHVHIAAFPIAVARVEHPELRSRPVVAASSSDRALTLCVSPEARKEGIFKGMPLERARRRCPGLTVVPPDPGLTERASGELGRLAARYTPLWEPFRPGHIYLDVTGTDRLWGSAEDAADRLRREIKEGLSLCGTAGVGGNKMVSNIASRILPAEGVVNVRQGREASFMAPLGVRLVPGIGRVRRRILLEELNITKVRELAALDMGRLRLIFGRRAFVIHQRALGIDPTPVYPVPAKPMIREDITLPQDENDDRKLLGALYGLVESCGRRLRERALSPRRAGLLIRYSDQAEARRETRLPRVSFWDDDLYSPLEALFYKLCTRRVRVRFMRVWFRDFSAGSGQLSLFHDPPSQNRAPAVIRALDRIRERHGEGSIGIGRRVQGIGL